MLQVMRFTAPWCKPCKVLGPILDEVKDQFEDVEFTAIDVDQNEHAAESWDIRGVPTVIFLKDNEIVEKFVGVKPKESIVELIQKYK